MALTFIQKSPRVDRGSVHPSGFYYLIHQLIISLSFIKHLYLHLFASKHFRMSLRLIEVFLPTPDDLRTGGQISKKLVSHQSCAQILFLLNRVKFINHQALVLESKTKSTVNLEVGAEEKEPQLSVVGVSPRKSGTVKCCSW